MPNTRGPRKKAGEQIPLADMIEAEQPADEPTPEPEEEPTPEELRIRELEHELALERGRKDPEPVYQAADEVELPDERTVAGDRDTIVIHILEDGFTALGQVWYRGQELEFVPGSEQHRATFNKRGESWLDLRNNEFAQAERWTKIMFRDGPWPGRSYLDAGKAEYTGESPSEEQLRHAEQAETRRRRGVPLLAAR